VVSFTGHVEQKMEESVDDSINLPDVMVFMGEATLLARSVFVTGIDGCHSLQTMWRLMKGGLMLVVEL
jgi:hypothetical protein